MDPALAQLGWTEEQWNRICTTVTEEAQKARVAAQVLPVVGPEDASTVAVPPLTLGAQPAPAPWPAINRMFVDSNPTLNLTTIAVDIPLRGHEIADPELKAALTMFRRAANYIARIEDAIVFNGRGPYGNVYIGGPQLAVPAVFSVNTDATQFDNGVFTGGAGFVPINRVPFAQNGAITGPAIVTAVINAITLLENRGQLAPFGLVLGADLFEAAHNPTPALVLPRDRILPLIQGPLVRASTGPGVMGALVALSGSPVELVVATDIGIKYLQTTVEPRYIFRVSERIALRIKERDAIAIFMVLP